MALMEEWLPPSRSGSFHQTGALHPLAKACDQCHRCKVACDGRRPACDRCAKSDSTCTYSTGKPIGKPKGSKNRTKSQAQRPGGNKDFGCSNDEERSGKRKSYADVSQDSDELTNHKRQRSDVYLPTPTSLNDPTPSFFDESDILCGTSIPSLHSSEPFEPLTLQLSPKHLTEYDIDAPFDPDPDVGSDWISDMVNDAPSDTVLNITAQGQDHSVRSLKGPYLPQRHDFSDLLERGSSNILAGDKQHKGQSCNCTKQLLATIPELENISKGGARIAVEGILRLTRRCSSAISAHFDCRQQPLTKPTSTFMLTCVLVLIEIGANYALLRRRLEEPEWQKHLPVSVGGLTIEEGETRQRVMHAVLDAEVRQTLALSNKLQHWADQAQAGSNPLPWEPLLSFARRELDLPLEQGQKS